MTRNATRTARRPTDAGNLAALVQAFHRHLRALNRSPETITAYAKATTGLLAFLAEGDGPTTAEGITREHVESYLIAMRDRGLADATVSQHYRSLHAFFGWLASEDHASNAMLRMRAPTVTRREVPVVSDGDMDKLLNNCGGRHFADRRDAAMLRLLFATGMRLGELTRLTVEDVDLDQRLVKVLGKGGTYRTVPYTAQTSTAMDRYLILRDQHAHANATALFIGQDGALTRSGIGQIIRRRAARAGVKLHAHMLRHSFAANWMMAGGPEQSLLEIAGWSSPAMLQRYGRATRAARAQAHYEQFAPRTKR